jgi:hypothetical protein
VLDVEDKQERVRDVRANAYDAKVLQDKVENERQVNTTNVSQHAQEDLQS